MKNKLFICIVLSVIALSCTKNSGLTLTLPDKSLILEKLDGNNYTSTINTATKASFNVESANIEGKNYTFEKEVFAVAGFYKEDGAEGKYLLIYPTLNSVNTYTANQKAYDAINLILDIIDTEKDGAVVLNNFVKALATKDNADIAANLINANDILNGASISTKKEVEVRQALGALNKAGQPKDFDNGETFNYDN